MAIIKRWGRSGGLEEKGYGFGGEKVRAAVVVRISCGSFDSGRGATFAQDDGCFVGVRRRVRTDQRTTEILSQSRLRMTLPRGWGNGTLRMMLPWGLGIGPHSCDETA